MSSAILFSPHLQAEAPAAGIKEGSVERVVKQIFREISSDSKEGLAAWRKKMTVLDPRALDQILVRLVEEIARLDHPDRWIETLSEWIPLETLEEIVRTRHPEHISALSTAKEMREEARHFFAITEKRPAVSWRAKGEALFDLCIGVLEAVINAFGLADFFKTPESSLDADIKSGRVMQLLMLFTTLSTLLLPVLGPTLSTAIVGGTLLGTTSLSLVFPYIRPAPSSLPKAVNWTKQYKLGELIAPMGRKDTLDAIAALLSSTSGVKTHPMLIGKSGAGKTETAKAFVQAIERGDYPELKGKQVFYFNMADLVQGSEVLTGENKVLSNIDQAMGLHRENMILIFDEIQLACQKDISTMGERLKTMLDPGNGCFPYVIGITTEEEYYRDIYLNNSAFARRFRRINIDNPIEAETLEILRNAALREAPQILIAEKAMETLAAKAKEAFGKETPEPITSLKILTKCLQKTADTQKSPLSKQREELRIQIRSLYAESAAAQSLLPYSQREKLACLEQELKEIEVRLEKEEAELSRFYRRREELLALKKRAFQMALSLSKPEEKELAAFLLFTHYLAPAKAGFLIEEAGKLQLKTVLDAALMDEVIAEELANDRKVQEAVDRGRAQIEARAQ